MSWFSPILPASSLLLGGLPPGVISEAASSSDSADATRVINSAAVTESTTASDSAQRVVVPQILGTAKGTDSTDVTTHTVTLPSGIKNGELLILAISSNGTPTLSSPSGWRGTSQASGGMTSRVCYKYATGEESISPGTITFTTSVAEKCSWVVLRISKGAIMQHHHFSTGTATTSLTNARYKSGTAVKESLLLSFNATNLDSLPTAPSTDYELVDSQAGNNTDGSSMYVQKRNFLSVSNAEETPSAQTLSVSTDYASRMMSVTFVQPGNEVFGFWHDHGASGHDLNSTGPVLGTFQSFVGNGARIERIGINIRRSSTVSGTIQVKIYELSGKYSSGGTAVPTGSALATATTTVTTLSNLSTTVWQYEEFVFSTPFRTEMNKVYAFTVECADISGGSLRIAKAGSATGKGNSGESADLSTWNTTDPNDLVHFIQFIKNDSPYKFKTKNERLDTPDNEIIDGWEAMEEHPHISSVSGASVTSTYAIQTKAVKDGLTVWKGQAINDDAGTTSTVERAQISLDWYNQPDQDNVYHFRVKMKFHADLEYLRANRTSGIGIGYPDWIDFHEIWLHLNPAWGGDTAGSARWNININRAAGTNQPFTWYLKGEKRQPAIEQGVDFWNASNSTIAVQCDKWFYLDTYMKVGEGTNGRMTVKIKYEGEDEQTLFDINDTTLYYEGEPQLKVSAFNPVKVYTSDAIMDWMASNGKEFTMYAAEFTWFNDDVVHVEEDALGIAEVITGSTPVNASVTESTTATDSEDATQIAVKSVTESASSTDAPDATWVGTRTVSETTSATDAPAGTQITSRDLTEATSATESTDGTVIQIKSITETTSATESQDRTAVLLGTASEAASATDTPAATQVAVKSVTETTSPTDTPNATRQGLGTITNEAASATDSPNRTAILQGTMSETASATDSPAATWTGVKSISETTTASDSADASTGGVQLISEAASASDSQSATMVAGKSVTEAASASDVPGATAVSSRSLTEGASAQDLIAASAILQALMSEPTTGLDVLGVQLETLGSIVENTTSLDASDGSTAQGNEELTEAANAQAQCSAGLITKYHKINQRTWGKWSTEDL